MKRTLLGPTGDLHSELLWTSIYHFAGMIHPYKTLILCGSGDYTQVFTNNK